MTSPKAQPDLPSPRFQFSLRSLLILTTVVAIGLSLIKWVPELWPVVLNAAIGAVAVYINRFFPSNLFGSMFYAIIVVSIVMGGLYVGILLSVR